MIGRRLGNKLEPADPNTLLLLHGEDFTDSSMYAQQVNKTGTVNIASSGKFNNCMYFGGGYLSQAITLGTADFTIDFWLKMPSTPTTNYPEVMATSVDNVIGGWYISCPRDPRKIRFVVASPCFAITDTTALPLNVWTHCAFVRTGTTITIYRDGVAKVNGTLPTGHDFSLSSCKIGTNTTGTEPIKSYLDEIRISNIARWTDNFTPPTEPYTK